ncbi:MAG TPA: recombination protein RecR, partial [Sphaerochaeta sp.]|nr:recombination protein RecR [Sphaerochaeta sp.]
MTSLDTLIKDLSRLPGIGPKSATRLAYHLLKSDPSYNRNLA